MSNVAKINRKAVTVFDTVRLEESLTKAATFNRHAFDACFRDQWNNAQRAKSLAGIREIREAITTGAYAEMKADLDTASSKATDRDIAQEVALLIAAFPMAHKAELGPFTAILASDLRETGPSLYAIKRAFRGLRRGNKFLPTIAEVLTAIAEQETHLRIVADSFCELPVKIEREEKILAAIEETMREPGAMP